MCVNLLFPSYKMLFINRCHYIPTKVLINLFITLWNQVCVFSLYFIKDESSTESSWFIWVIITIISHLSAQKCLCDALWLFIWFLLLNQLSPRLTLQNNPCFYLCFNFPTSYFWDGWLGQGLEPAMCLRAIWI